MKRDKSAYIYSLPDRPDFELYGVNYEGDDRENIHYHGSFLADEIPYHLKGGFGLVWDGDSAETCNGAWGEYLRYNNPHKTSLYLACGIPVIIWENAVLAGFVIDHNVGITVKSLTEIDDTISKLTDEEYRQMKESAVYLSKSIRRGHYIKSALIKAGLYDSKRMSL